MITLCGLGITNVASISCPIQKQIDKIRYKWYLMCMNREVAAVFYSAQEKARYFCLKPIYILQNYWHFWVASGSLYKLQYFFNRPWLMAQFSFPLLAVIIQ